MSSVWIKMTKSERRRSGGAMGRRVESPMVKTVYLRFALVVAALAVDCLGKAGAFPSLGGGEFGSKGGQQMELRSSRATVPMQLGPDCSTDVQRDKPMEIEPQQLELGSEMDWPKIGGKPMEIGHQVEIKDMEPMMKGPLHQLQMMLTDGEHCEDNSLEEQKPEYSPYMMKFMDDEQHQQMEEEHHRIEPHVDYLEKQEEGPKYEVVEQDEDDGNHNEHQQRHQRYQQRPQHYRPRVPPQLKMSDFDLPLRHQFQRNRGMTSSYTGHWDNPVGQRKGYQRLQHEHQHQKQQQQHQHQQQNCEPTGERKSPPAQWRSKIFYRPFTSPRPFAKTVIRTTTETPHQQQEQMIFEPQRTTVAPTTIPHKPQQTTETPTKTFEPQQTSEAPPTKGFEQQRSTEAPTTKTVEVPQQQNTEAPPAKGQEQEREPESATTTSTTEAPIKTVVVVDEPQATEAPPVKGQEPEPAPTTTTTEAPTGKTVPVLQTNRDEPQEPFAVKFDDEARLRAHTRIIKEQQQLEQDNGQQLTAQEAGRVSDASFGETNINPAGSGAANQRARDSFQSAAELARSLASRHSSHSPGHSQSLGQGQTLPNGGSLTGWASVRTASIASEQPESAGGASAALYLGPGQLERHETNGRVQARLSCQLGADSGNTSVWSVEWARFEGAYDPEEASFECRSATGDCRLVGVKTDTLVTVQPRPSGEQPESYSMTIHQVEEQHLGTYRCSAMRRPAPNAPVQLVYRIVPLQSVN